MYNTTEPWYTTDNMFILFDYVHFIKNVQKNWITKTFQELDFHADGEKKTAKWADIKSLHNPEAD